MNALFFDYARYTKSKISMYDDKEDGSECESFIIISTNSLLVYENKHYLQVYLDNCTNKNGNREMVDFWQSWWQSF